MFFGELVFDALALAELKPEEVEIKIKRTFVDMRLSCTMQDYLTRVVKY